MASEIELNYSRFDAFVILHGTDTMAYTSSALSFLLEDLGKTIVRDFTLVFSLGASE
jgi:60kDa lysophospholipase